MRIQHNLSAMNSLSNYNANNNALSGNLEKLSSGYRINSAADDAAGLAISEKMRSQIAGLEKAQDNANDGISLVQTAEGALTEVNSMLTRLTELATQSANGTYQDDVDRENLQEEANALLDEMDRISQSTNFNGINLLDGSMSSSKDQVTQLSLENLTVGDQISFGGKTYTYTSASEAISGFSSVISASSFSVSEATTASTGKLESGTTVASGISYTFGTKAQAMVKATGSVSAANYVASTNITTGSKISVAVDSALASGTYTYKLKDTTSSVYTADGWYTSSGTALASTAITTTGLTASQLKDKTLTVASVVASKAAVTFNSNVEASGAYTYKDKNIDNVTESGWYNDSTGAFLETNDLSVTSSGTTAMKLTSGLTINVSDEGSAAVASTAGEWTVASGRFYTGSGTEITAANASQYVVANGSGASQKITVATAASTAADPIYDAKMSGTKVSITASATSEPAAKEDTMSFNTVDQLAMLLNRDGYAATVGSKTVDGNTVATVDVTANALNLQVGDTNTSFQHVAVDVSDMSATGLGLRNSMNSDGTTYLNISDQESAGNAIETIKDAVNKVSQQRGKLGATQNRLEHTLNNLDATDENITAAESQIRDVDMAKEMTEYSKNNILVQAAQSMLAQANSMPQGVLQLLG